MLSEPVRLSTESCTRFNNLTEATAGDNRPAVYMRQASPYNRSHLNYTVNWNSSPE